MAIKKISEFVSAVPSSDSKILFEQNEKGKSCTVGEAVNTCSLSYEEIAASTDLSGKIASASAVKDTCIVPDYNLSNMINVTELTTLGGTWTAPSNGVLRVYGVKDDDSISSEIKIRINSIDGNEILYRATNSSICYTTQYVPLKKGDFLKTLSFTNIYSSGMPRFFPSV